MTDATAELIARANHEADLHEANRSYMPGDVWGLIDDMAATIAAQAQEIERLTTDNETMDSRFREICDRGNSNRMRADAAEQRAEAAEAATIERCAELADHQRRGLRNGGAINACFAIAAAIRALAKEPPAPAASS